MISYILALSLPQIYPEFSQFLRWCECHFPPPPFKYWKYLEKWPKWKLLLVWIRENEAWISVKGGWTVVACSGWTLRWLWSCVFFFPSLRVLLKRDTSEGKWNQIILLLLALIELEFAAGQGVFCLTWNMQLRGFSGICQTVRFPASWLFTFRGH